MSECTIPGCSNVHKARWLCYRHYNVLRAAPVEVRMDWPTLHDGEPTGWDIERLLASEAATLAQDSATDSATDSARVAELEAECERLRGDLLQVAQHRDRLECERHDAVTALAEVETLLRAIYADVVSVEECERLEGARVVALGLRRVLTSRSEASCKRDGMMHVPRVHLETVASVLSRAADELEPWRTDRDGVAGLMVRASVDHLELLLEGE